MTMLFLKVWRLEMSGSTNLYHRKAGFKFQKFFSEELMSPHFLSWEGTGFSVIEGLWFLVTLLKLWQVFLHWLYLHCFPWWTFAFKKKLNIMKWKRIYKNSEKQASEVSTLSISDDSFTVITNVGKTAPEINSFCLK